MCVCGRVRHLRPQEIKHSSRSIRQINRGDSPGFPQKRTPYSKVLAHFVPRLTLDPVSVSTAFLSRLVANQQECRPVHLESRKMSQRIQEGHKVHFLLI